MSSFRVIGNLSKALNTGEFEWLISLSDEILEASCFLDSPTFSFSHGSWYIRMYPTGNINAKYMSLFLKTKEIQSEIYVEFSSEMIFQGMQLTKKDCNFTFGKNEMGYGWPEYVLKSVVLDLWSKKIKDCNQLIIKLRMSDKVPDKEDALLQKRKEGIKLLCQNYKDLLHNDKGHDLILKVKDKEFNVHKIIMQCQCPVFKAMLQHDMLEKNRGIVEIPDCDPLAFEKFILYIYSGDLETLDESLMPGLYYIADKYEMACLKEMCCEFLKKSLSPSNVCDVIKLALNHSDSTLLECGKKYFVDNVKKVLVTVEWQSFMKENLIQANELFIKTIDHYVPEDKTET